MKQRKKDNKNCSVCLKVCGWIVAWLNITAVILYLLVSIQSLFPSGHFVLWVSMIGLGLINILYLIACKRAQHLPKHEGVLAVGILFIALAKLTSLFALESIDFSILNIGSHLASVYIVGLLVFALLDLVFFAILKKLSITFGFKTYLFMTVVLFVLLVTPIICGLIAGTASIDPIHTFIITLALIFLATGAVTMIMGKLSQAIGSGSKPQPTKKRKK